MDESFLANQQEEEDVLCLATITLGRILGTLYNSRFFFIFSKYHIHIFNPLRTTQKMLAM